MSGTTSSTRTGGGNRFGFAVIYGYLKVDLATGGVYRGRLRFAAALAILGPVAAALLVVAPAISRCLAAASHAAFPARTRGLNRHSLIYNR